MAEEDGTNHGGELNSWKEIADHLGTTVRTAQRWESERRLPVRRMGGARGRVIASIAEIDEWKLREVLQPVRVWENPKWLRWYAAGATGLLLLTGGILGANYISRNARGAPAAFQWHDRQITVLDREGHKLWVYTFPHVLGSGPYDAGSRRGRVRHVDIDGDGTVETLFAYMPEDQMRLGEELYCFSESGQVLWRFTPGRVMRDADTEFRPPYDIRFMVVLDSPISPGQRWIVATGSHHLGYMSQTVLLGPDGEIRGEYWHPGHIDALELADVDGRPGEELLVGGENRHRGAATVVVLDSRKLAEEGPTVAEEYAQVRSHAVISSVFFPRTRLNRRLEEINHVSRLHWIGENLEVQVEEARVQRPGSDLNYVFDRAFSLKAIHPWDTIRSSYKEMFGPVDEGTRMFEEDLDMVRGNFQVIRGGVGAADR